MPSRCRRAFGERTVDEPASCLLPHGEDRLGSAKALNTRSGCDLPGERNQGRLMRWYPGCVAALMIAATSAQASDTEPAHADADAHWQFAVVPYLWLPSVTGTLRFSLPGGGADASTGPYNYF